MDIVLGVSMAPATIRMVLVEGENADGVTVDEDHFDLDDASNPATLSAADQVIAAILGTREGAGQGGHQLTSTGVTWTDPNDAGRLATALAARKIENVMLVSAFLAAAALAQTVGQAIGYEHTAMLFIEPDTATLAVVASADGSITDVQRRPLRRADLVLALTGMVAGLDVANTCAQGLFIVGCDVDITPLKPALEAASYLPVSAPEEPHMALARGAALASANAPLFASSTAALAYAQDPGTGEVDPYAVAPGYLEVHRAGAELREQDLAYSASPDADAGAETGVAAIVAEDELDPSPRRSPLLLVGSALAVVFVSAALALEIALALGIRPAVALRPSPGQALVAPATAAPTPPTAQLLPAPQPLPVHVAPPVHVPAAAPIAPPAPVPAPIPVAPVPVPIPVPIRVGIPAPAIRAPLQRPPLDLPVPRPQWQAPNPPLMRQPNPQWRTPPFRRSVPQPPMNIGGPQGPRFPMMPAPQGPRFPGPMMPRMPAPMFPRMPGPMMPAMPHFNLPFPSFRR